MKKKILILYAGIGGIRKEWGDEFDITAIEINKEVAEAYKKFFPEDKIIITDAHEYLLKNYHKYDIITASSPCPTHSKMAVVNHKRYDLRQYPDMRLYQEIIFLQQFFKGLYFIENVKPYYEPLIEAQKIGRHLVWANFKITPFKTKSIKNFIDANATELQDWLGMYLDKNIYLGGNHDPCQVFRNCVHPSLGKHILDCALNKYDSLKIYNGTLFETKQN